MMPSISMGFKALVAIVSFSPVVFSLEPRACLPASSFTPSLTYVGCYTDPSTSNRILSDRQILISENSVKACADICANLKYKYFGVEFGRQCFCGNQINTSGSKVAESQCNTACPGNSTATCGGANRIGIWSVANAANAPDVPLFPDCTREPLCSNAVCDTSLSVQERAEGIVSLFSVSEKMNNYINTAEGVPRLGLRSYQWWNEALHGLASSPGSRFAPRGSDFSYASSFPLPIVMASAFDDEMVAEIGQITGSEVRAFHNVGRSGVTLYTPNINTFKDPRWGRGMETPGEDPFHTQSYAAAILSGLEDSSTGFKKSSSTCKHYAANDFENFGSVTRHNFDAKISLQELSEYYLPPFKTCAVDSNVGSFMCSYNSVNGKPLCANDYLLEDVLREHWDWKDANNFVSTDCDAVKNIYNDHRYVSTAAQAAAVALKAGTDLQCNGSPRSDAITAAYEGKLVTEAEIDKSLVRLWASLVMLGLFNPKDSQPLRSLAWKDVNTARAQQLAYDAAVAGSVLIKNDGTLPLNKTANKRYAFIGPWVEATNQMQGIYSGPAPFLVSPRAAADKLGINLSFNLGSQINANDSSFDAAVTAARNADVIVYMGGIDSSIERESNDRRSLAWPDSQARLLRTLAGIGKPVVVVQFGGGQLDDTEWLASQNIRSILWGGYPGQSGGTAILDLLFGNAAPAGRLSVTQYPASYYSDVPPTDMNLRPASGNKNLGRTYMWYTGKTPVPFGHGLHYTNFSVTLTETSPPSSTSIATLVRSDVLNGSKLGWNTVLTSAPLKLTVTAENRGKVKSDYVALLFLKASVGPTPRPIKTLVGYQRIKGIEPGAKGSADISVTLERLVRVDAQGNRVLHAGTYQLFVDLDQKASYTLTLTGTDTVIEKFPQVAKRD
jgi:beta-D-xylosidase 4